MMEGTGTMSRRQRQMRRKPRKGKRKIKKKPVLLTVLVALLLFGSLATIQYRTLFVNPVDIRSHELIGGFKFEPKETIRDIAKELKEKGLITSEWAMRLKAMFRGIEYVGKPGNYAFTKAMTLDEILSILDAGETAYDYQIPVGDGTTLDKVLFDFAENEEQIRELDAKINNPDYIRSLMVKYPFLPQEILGDGFIHRLEGFLGNGMYYLKDDATIETLIEQALDRFQENYRSHQWEQKLRAANKTLFDVVTMASVVRGEVFSGDTKNQKIVAGVFYNRLADGMTFGSDVTVGYAINAPDINYTMAELNYDSPYNTYVYPGLPKGPINNPGADVIDAVLDYNQNDYYYFIADICDDDVGEYGEIYYARTEAEHNANIQRYLGCYRTT